MLSPVTIATLIVVAALAALIGRILHRRSPPTLRIFCPICRDDLYNQRDSYCENVEGEFGCYRYVCQKCGWYSYWDFTGLVPGCYRHGAERKEKEG